jgi:pimeloyl-ACP methyl ester carboxylesterase
VTKCTAALKGRLATSFATEDSMTKYQYATVDGKRIFYRAAGLKIAPTILLLHGFPTSPHMFHDLIPALADSYHLVAPDLPGFGFSDAPDNKR